MKQETTLMQFLQMRYPGLEKSYTINDGTILTVTDYYLTAVKEQDARCYRIHSIFEFPLASAFLKAYKKDLDNSIDESLC